MLAKQEWFAPRKYGGWGVRPISWQGWVYLGFILLPFIIFQSLSFWSDQTRIYATIGWLTFVFLDIGHVMITMKRDEREEKLEALSDRNAVWAMILVLISGMLYQLIRSELVGDMMLDPFIAGTLLAGASVKSISMLILNRKGL